MVKRKIIHLLLTRDFKDGSCFSGTLCGKMQWQGGDAVEGGGNNITENPKEVTYKLCLRKMKQREINNDQK